MSEHTDTFMAITGCEDGAVAEQFLDMAGGDLETAISLFYEHGPSVVGSSNINNVPGGNDQGIVGDEDADRQFAESLQNQYHQEEPTRAPDEARHETLVGDADYNVFPGTYGGVGGMFNPLLNGGRAGRGDVFGSGRAGIFNQTHESLFGDDDEDEDADGDTNRIVEVDSDGEEIDPNLTSTQRRLAKIFRPPWDLIEKLDLDSAKKKGRTTEKWILINMQDNSNFQCQVLNRDFWSSYQIKEIVRDNFIFLQYQSNSITGEQYKNFYHFEEYPHIAILDPLTGERLKMWSGVPDISKWTNEVEEFLHQFSLKPNHINPIVTHKKKIDPTTLTEEQQLEFAIKQSLGNKDPADVDDVEILNSGDANDPIEIDDDEDDDNINEPKELSDEDKFRLIKPIQHMEPTSTENTTRIQIRTSDGSRKVLKFLTDNKVITIYELIKATFPQVSNNEFFVLTSQRENLITKLDQTIADAGLKNASILLEVNTDD